MFLEKDLPIIGRDRSGLPARLLRMAAEGLLKFSEPCPFPGDSFILDAKGKPFRKGGSGTIRFRRYEKFKTGGHHG